METFRQKRDNLLRQIDSYTDKDIIIAFSGGVDSSLLLKLACDNAHKKNTNVHAVTIHTALHPIHDIEISKKVAKEMGAIHSLIEVDELSQAGIINNPVDRCYLCKKFLFSKLKELAKSLEIETVIEGTNEDDLHVYRPGIKAIKELGVISPLANANMTKADIRQMAADYNISVATRPSAPCLATRFPYNTTLSYSKMKKIEKGEEYLKSLGLYNVRIRLHGDIARIEIDKNDMTKLLSHNSDIISYLKDLGFIFITLDLEGFRSGSMDYNIKL